MENDQGIVSIVKGDQVAFKIIAGSNADKAEELAKHIRKNDFDELSINLLYQLATHVGFGSKEDLIVQSQVALRFDGEKEKPNGLYREKFTDPSFNPLQSSGLAEHVRILKY